MSDAQCRDWSAERADRVGFARLAQAHWEIEPVPNPLERWWSAAAVLGAGVLTSTVVLLLADRAAAPLTLAWAMFAGVLAGHVVIGTVWAVREWWARHDVSGPAAIDDPYLYAELTRALEAARADQPDPDRAAALERALFWVDAARDELTYRTFPAGR